jgi:predicted transcriptional regulator
MDQPSTIFDDVDEAAEEAALLAAEAEIDAGRGVPHEVVGEWLKELASGRAVPPTFLKA